MGSNGKIAFGIFAGETRVSDQPCEIKNVELFYNDRLNLRFAYLPKGSEL